MNIKDHINIVQQDKESMQKIQEILDPLGLNAYDYVSKASFKLIYLIYGKKLEELETITFIQQDSQFRENLAS